MSKYSPENYRVVPLESIHDKTGFQCGNAILDNYLQKIATQDIKRKLAVCYVLVGDNQIIKGFYTLSNSGIDRASLPETISRKLPKAYSILTVTLLGRLAIDINVKGKGFGKILLIDALKKSIEVSGEIGSMAVIVDPIDKPAKEFYEKYGFILLPDSEKMFLPMKTISTLFY